MAEDDDDQEYDFFLGFSLGLTAITKADAPAWVFLRCWFRVRGFPK